MATYRVVLNGVLKGLEARQVAPQLAAVCKIPVQGAMALLSNPGTVIKGALDLEMATAYKTTLRGVGCQVLVEQEGDATNSVSSSALRTLGKHKLFSKLTRWDLQGRTRALAARVRNAMPGFSKTQRDDAPEANGAIATASDARTPSRFAFPARWQPALNKLSAKIATLAPGFKAPPRVKKFLGVNTLVIASVAITAAAIAGVLATGTSVTAEPCPEGTKATESMTCVGEMNFPNGEKYVGEVKDGQPHGRGTFIWPNGEKYVGDWKNGQRNGRGRFFWPDGTKYFGDFRNNKKHGQGTYTYANGRTYTGQWKNGNPVEEAGPLVDGEISKVAKP